MTNKKWNDSEEIMIRQLEGLVKDKWAKAERENDKEKIKEMSNLAFFLKTIKKG